MFHRTDKIFEEIMNPNFKMEQLKAKSLTTNKFEFFKNYNLYVLGSLSIRTCQLLYFEYVFVVSYRQAQLK